MTLENDRHHDQARPVQRQATLPRALEMYVRMKVAECGTLACGVRAAVDTNRVESRTD
jgi:hypothetical protein